MTFTQTPTSRVENPLSETLYTVHNVTQHKKRHTQLMAIISVIQSAVMLIVANKPIMFSFVMLNVTLLSVGALFTTSLTT